MSIVASDLAERLDTLTKLVLAEPSRASATRASPCGP